MKSAGIVFVLIVYLAIIAAGIAGMVGYYINIADLIHMILSHSSDTPLELFRALGVVVAPLGAILGLFV